MKENSFKILTIIQVFLAVYLGFFIFWLVFSLGCIADADAKNVYFEDHCGGDDMTKIARSGIYRPLYNFLLK